MARKARMKSASGIYAVLIRGTETLFRDGEDYAEFISRMEKYIGAAAYALIPEAVCMVAKESDRGVSADIKPLTTSYARYFNRKYGREGALFGGRFVSEPLETAEQIAEYIFMTRDMPSLVGQSGRAECRPDWREYVSGGAADKTAELEIKITEPEGIFAVLAGKRRTAEKGGAAKKAETEAKRGIVSEKPAPEPEKKSKKKKKMPPWLL